MKNIKFLLISVVLLFMACLFPEYSLAADYVEYYDTIGKAARNFVSVTYFFVTVNNSTGSTITLHQNEKGLMHWTDIIPPHDADREAYATYYVNYKRLEDQSFNGYNNYNIYYDKIFWCEEWDEEDFLINFNSPGTYVVRVSSPCNKANPKYAEKFYTILSNWEPDHWETAPTWCVSRTYNCQVSTILDGKVTIRIYKDGKYAESYTKTISSSQYISADYINGFTCTPDSQYVSLDQRIGKCNPETIEFYYISKSNPVITSTPSNSPVITSTPSNLESTDKYLAPYGWDTKFRAGVSEFNPYAYLKMDRLTDGNANTYFKYILYKEEKTNGLPDFTAYFDNCIVSGIKIRNGDADEYENYMRINEFHVIVYTKNDIYTESTMTIPDRFRTDYYTFDFQRNYKDVNKIEIYIDDRHEGQSARYIVHIRDIDFY